jgi:hypothetical protein
MPRALAGPCLSKPHGMDVTPGSEPNARDMVQGYATLGKWLVRESTRGKNASDAPFNSLAKAKTTAPPIIRPTRLTRPPARAPRLQAPPIGGYGVQHCGTSQPVAGKRRKNQHSASIVLHNSHRADSLTHPYAESCLGKRDYLGCPKYSFERTALLPHNPAHRNLQCESRSSEPAM